MGDLSEERGTGHIGEADIVLRIEGGCEDFWGMYFCVSAVVSGGEMFFLEEMLVF